MATDIVTHNGEDFKIKFDREHTKRLQLEEECDLLALENVRLREENSLLKHQLGIQVRLNTLTETIETINITSSSAIINNDFLEEGDDLHPNHAFKTINNACHGKNCIAVTYCCDGKYVLCAGGDNSLHLYSTGETESVVMWTYKLSAPATSLQSYGSYVACALFDGSLTMVSSLYHSNLC